MPRRARLAILPLIAATLASAAPPSLGEQRARLATAKGDAARAAKRAAALQVQADAERDAALQARQQEAAVVERIAAAEAEIVAARARVAITGAMAARARATLAERQMPVLRLVAALQSLARRPDVLALAQPGSTADAVHVRAALGGLMPVIARRSAAVRREIAEVHRLRTNAQLAARSLADGRAALQRQRMALVTMEGEHRLRSRNLARGALFESDRAIALGEEARDLLDRMEAAQADATTGEALATLSGPLPRPAEVGGAQPSARFAVPPYRLPAAGRVVSGLGEPSGAGVRARGLTLATVPSASVVAPAAGRVLFARRFRGYGVVVIIDHGNGWSSALTGLASAGVKAGDTVSQGGAIGAAPDGGDPRVTVELRRRGVPVDLAQLLG